MQLYTIDIIYSFNVFEEILQILFTLSDIGKQAWKNNLQYPDRPEKQYFTAPFL